MAKKTTKKSFKKASKTTAKKATQKTTKSKSTKQVTKKSVKAKKKSPAKAKISQSKTATKSAVIYKGPKVGETVPDFELPGTSGAQFSLQHYRGKKVVLYFYPKDSTPGCTIEGNDFSRMHQQFLDKNTHVFGISRDSLKSHENFKCNQNFQFELLSDAGEKACKIFDVIQEKNMYGNITMGIERSTFVIDENGKLAKEWRKVKVEGHADEVLQSL